MKRGETPSLVYVGQVTYLDPTGRSYSITRAFILRHKAEDWKTPKMFAGRPGFSYKIIPYRLTKQGLRLLNEHATAQEIEEACV